jgi:aspartokinase
MEMKAQTDGHPMDFIYEAVFEILTTASIVLKMEAASTSEKSVNFYYTTRHYNPQDSHLHS